MGKNLQSFVLNSGPQVRATATVGTDTISHVFTEDRNIVAIFHRVGQAFTGPLLEGAVVETISEISVQALGLQPGAISTLSMEVMTKALILAPANGVALWWDRVKEVFLKAPEGFSWNFKKGESINMLNWYNNGSGGDQTYHHYAIFHYYEP
ncbi:hypothetical protein ES703_108159 [subsurface metagenome]